VSLIKHDDPKTRGASIDASTLAAALAPEIAALIVGKLTGLVALGDDAILGEDAAAQALNKSRSTLEAWRAKGIGPRTIRLGPRAIGYRVGDLRQYIREEAEQKRVGPCR
jgi:predicted DNA-binding transcriptional regulator AlpA